ncbi:MAG: GNAT family N-acetyltransferase [Planctomycetota bacterium]
MKIRPLTREQIELAVTIDRGEVIDEIYYFEEDNLVLKKEHWDVKGFEPGHLEEHVEEMKRSLDGEGVVAGAFDGDKLAGIVALESEFLGKEGETLQLSFLHVDRAHRNCGVGRALVEFAGERAARRGAKKLYISASPSKSTIDFYLGCGARLADKVDKRLYALEPEDIHLVLPLVGTPEPHTPNPDDCS